MHKRVTLLIAGMGLLATTVGCAAMRAASAKHRHIRSQAEQFVYQKSITEVWPQARQMLFEKGLQVRDTGEAGTLTLETDWLSDNAGGSSRYLVQGIKVDEATCKVQFTKATKRSAPNGQTSTSSDRDVDAEWDLIKRVAPEKAVEIESEAELKGEAARAESQS